ncbi:ACT domain-containing protein ACR2 isoform X2 [Aristolochia californica]|uniref:ACT domain-containing protein ACR2 isoform X2 n=1 Tax=Aristolochia californica TaxID=171875 RepID=UPI0035E0F7CB
MVYGRLSCEESSRKETHRQHSSGSFTEGTTVCFLASSVPTLCFTYRHRVPQNPSNFVVFGEHNQAIGSKRGDRSSTEHKTCSSSSSQAVTAIEMRATNRPGLFSEISAVLADLRCNVIEAHAWSHNDRLACIVHISDELTSNPIEDPTRLADIEDHLSTVLGAANVNDTSDVRTGRQGCNGPITNKERRLHQLMLANGDFGTQVDGKGEEEERKPIVSVERCNDKGYSMVTVECKDRPKLLFDTVCTLTDMQYVIFHASIACNGSYTSQEYYIRHMDGRTMNTEGEKERVTICVEAAIERRVCEGVRLEICTQDRVGLLSDVTRLLREHGLMVVRADVMTEGERVINEFYVRDISGNAVDMNVVESMRKEIEPLPLQVTHETLETDLGIPGSYRQSLGDMLKSQIEKISQNIIAII